jgi:RNA-directed DNA polymerase
MLLLVKQIRAQVVHYFLLVVQLILIGVEYIWTVILFSYNNLFRFDLVLQEFRYHFSVPKSGHKYRDHNFIAYKSKPADHARTIKISRKIKTKSFSLFYKESRLQASLCLSSRSLKFGQAFSSFSLWRRYYWQGISDRSKWDFTSEALALKCETQSIESLIPENLRPLKSEIKIKHKNLVWELKKLRRDIWPMSKHGILIRELVTLRQKYLAKLSKLYGYNSKITQMELLNFLTQIDMRIFAIDSLLRSKGSKTAGIDNVILTKDNAQEFLDLLTYKKLKVYKSSSVKIISIPKVGNNKWREIGILTIYDRLVQKLFLLVLDPIIDVHSDKSSYGFRNGRNAHQAIGLVASILSKQTTKKYIVQDKYILNLDIKNFFGSVSHDWLINNYPFPSKLKFILEQWLSYEKSFSFDTLSLNVSNDNLGFPQGSIIGPSLANFTLDGLEFECMPSQKTAINEKKIAFLDAQNIKYKPGSGIVRKSLTSTVIRFVDDFLVITNDEKQSIYILNKIKSFLSIRGLTLNDEKTKIISWKNNSKFDFLGFTFHYLTKPRPGRITEQRDSNNRRKIRGGLYVYPSNDSISKFKKKIKLLFVKNLNLTPYKLILLLNPIIRGWGNYFAIGTKRVFSRLDHFIWFRTWRWLRRKYKKVSTKILYSRFYSGSKTDRSWHFHATWNNASPELIKRKGKILHLILLTRLTPGIPAQTFKPIKEVVNESYFINQEGSINWNVIINKSKSIGVSENLWSKLYNKQQGLCTLCQQDLGYFNSDNLHIHHKEQVAVNPRLIHNFENQELVHISCHKTVPIIKPTRKKFKDK